MRRNSRLYYTFHGLLSAAFILLFTTCAESAEMREVYRIRVTNREGGRVEVSADGGKTYRQVGMVLHAADRHVQGFLASIYAPPGTVAATAVHSIRIKVGGAKGCSRADTRMISILPREFAVTPKGFGGHVAGSSGIQTDIPTGAAVFRNLAPFVGNPVYLESYGRMSPLPSGYTPGDGDVLVIVVNVPVRWPKEIVLENRVGGHVRVVYPDRTEAVARVERPVMGVGRFDATGYTGVGRINTNHTGVLTISTAPIASGDKDGSSVETRGGFMIQPSRHAKDVSYSPQAMVVAPLSRGAPWLEGAPPLFFGYIGLAHDSGSEESCFRVDMKTSDSGWTALPALVGRNDKALSRMPHGGSVTHIRISFPSLSPGWVQAQLTRCSREWQASALMDASPHGITANGGTIVLALDRVSSVDTAFVYLYLDGSMAGVSNSFPVLFPVDTRWLSPGTHLAELRAVDSAGNVVKSITKRFLVQSGEVPGDG